MRTRKDNRSIRFPDLSCGVDAEERIEFMPDDEEDTPCSEYVVMNEERHMPALQEYLYDLRERDARTIH